jgi:hypothetical protein
MLAVDPGPSPSDRPPARYEAMSRDTLLKNIVGGAYVKCVSAKSRMVDEATQAIVTDFTFELDKPIAGEHTLAFTADGGTVGDLTMLSYNMPPIIVGERYLVTYRNKGGKLAASRWAPSSDDRPVTIAGIEISADDVARAVGAR